MLTQQRLKELLHYDQETGVFTRIASKTRTDLIGLSAGSIDGNGYVLINVLGKVYKAHRLAWLWFYGEFPSKQLDHENLDRTDNRISNLRESTQSQNMMNRTALSNSQSQVKGVHWVKRNKKWCATVYKDKKPYYLGLFSTIDEAECAVLKKREELHGEFCRHA